MKVCSKCKVEKELKEFHKRNDSKDGLRADCKECYNSYKREYKNLNKDRVNEYGRNYYKENVESVKDTRDKNRENVRISKKKYYQKNKEVLLEKAKEYYLTIKDSRDEDFHKRHWIKNKDSITKRIKDKKLNDPLFKLSSTIRNLLCSSIKKMGYTKNSKTESILGVTFQDFKIYIEEQFIEGMSWENHGEWHLDHKTPISWAETEEQVYELNKYSNFQPLWSFDNLSKGNRYSN